MRYAPGATPRPMPKPKTKPKRKPGAKSTVKGVAMPKPVAKPIPKGGNRIDDSSTGGRKKEPVGDREKLVSKPNTGLGAALKGLGGSAGKMFGSGTAGGLAGAMARKSAPTGGLAGAIARKPAPTPEGPLPKTRSFGPTPEGPLPKTKSFGTGAMKHGGAVPSKTKGRRV